MADFEILHEMIVPAAIVPVDSTKARRSVCLTEPENTSCITISGLPEKTMIIKTDSFRAPDTWFNGTKGERKRSDFIIIADNGRKKVILYIEMKSSTDPRKEIIQQLKGAQCVMAYCREVGRVFWERANFLGGYETRFICLKHVGLQKRPSKVEPPTARHDKADRMLELSCPSHLEFNQLAGR